MAEHLITSTEASVPMLEVPYVSKYSCKIGHFLLYPGSRGFMLNNAGFLVVREDQHEELVSLLQEWLYFGLLQEFLGHPVNILDFLRLGHGSEQQIINSSPLPRILQSCRERLLAMPKGNREKHFESLLTFVQIAASQCRFLDQPRAWSQTHHLREVLLSIRFLLDSLVITAVEFDDRLDTSTKHQRYPLGSEMESFPPSVLNIVSHMLQNGWCRHQCRWICERFTFNVIYYLASFSRRPSTRGHETCENDDHCVANNLDTTSYQCRHVKEGCSCDFMSTPTTEVTKIIQRGQIPVVSFSRTPSGELQQNVIRAKYSTQYTAISHIWNDGLGNPNHNSLPKCQLERLVEQVRAANLSRRKSEAVCRNQSFQEPLGPPRPVNMWMDTLCIPVLDENSKIKAINRMTPTYLRAENVLVLDSALSAASSKANRMDTCAQLLVAAWNGRSWTLQEGALAQTLDMPISSCDPFHHRSIPREAQYIHAELHKAHQLPAVGRWEASGRRSIRSCQFVSVWNALSGRTTTKTKDLHGIFANLLDFHAEEIILLDPKQRMKAILCAQECLPVKLLYNGATRDLIPGPFDRWIPDIPKGTFISESDSWMDVTTKGLLIKREATLKRTVIIKHEPRTSARRRYYVEIEGLGKVGITTQISSSHPYSTTVFDTTVLHMNSDAQETLAYGIVTTGACFAVVGTEQAVLSVIYQDAITLKLMDGMSEEPDFRDCLCFIGTLMKESPEILIDTGKPYLCASSN